MSRSSSSVQRVVAVLNFFFEHPGQSFTFTDFVLNISGLAGDISGAKVAEMGQALVEARVRKAHF